jgi:primosomal protein DnaI
MTTATTTPTEVFQIKGKCHGCGTSVNRAVVKPEGGGTFARLLSLIYLEQEQGKRPIYCDTCDEHPDPMSKEEKALRLNGRYERSNVPPRFREIEWGDLDNDLGRRAAIGEARRFTIGQSKMPGLFLWGPVGVGKTRILGAAVTPLIRAGIRVRWIDVAALLTDLRGAFSSAAYTRAHKQLSSARPGEVLVLDDLDKVQAHDREVQPLYVAINQWVNAEERILVTANNHLDHLAKDLGQRYGEPIASRLIGQCSDFEVTGRDRRMDEPEPETIAA